MKRSFRWRLLLFVVCGASIASGAQAPSGPHKIAGFDFFGSAGLDTGALQQRLQKCVGQPVELAHRDEVRRAVQADVLAAVGKPATDVAMVCCEQEGGVRVFVGLRGATYHPLQHLPPLTGKAVLPGQGSSLYEDRSKALAAAVASGHAGEDDSRGYALSEDPAARAVEERIRAYALVHEAEIRTVLRGSASTSQRLAAAELLGYAQRSTAQISALTAAANDPDDGVRNNATRALMVLANSGPMPGFETTPFVAMLYSGTWTDRNKASALLAAVTRARDPALLKTLRKSALPALIEGARWHSWGHAVSFATVLGHIAGWDETRIEQALTKGNIEALVNAALVARTSTDRRTARRSSGFRRYTQARHERGPSSQRQ